MESGSFEECNMMAVFGQREVWHKGQMVLVWDAGALMRHVVVVNLWCLRETTFEHIDAGLKKTYSSFLSVHPVVQPTNKAQWQFNKNLKMDLFFYD